MKKAAIFFALTVLMMELFLLSPALGETFIQMSINQEAPIKIGKGVQTPRTVYACPAKSKLEIWIYIPKEAYDKEFCADLYYMELPSGENKRVRLPVKYKDNNSYIFVGELTVGENRFASEAYQTEYIIVKKIDLLKAGFSGSVTISVGPDGYIGTVGTVSKSFSIPEISLGSSAIEIWVNDCASKTKRITNEQGEFILTPSITNLRTVWDGVETPILRGENRAVKRGTDDLKIKFNLSSLAPEVCPTAVRMTLFRPDENGEILEGTRRAELVEKMMERTNNPSLNWGEFEWVIKPDDFNRGGAGFREGTYLFSLEVTPLDGGTESERVYFRVLGDPPAITVAKTVQKGIDGIEFAFDKKKLNSRFDVAVSISPNGPFNLISRDVIDSKPPPSPWDPYSEIFEPWEFLRTDSQKYFASFLKIREALNARSIPPEIYFRFRAIDEAGNLFSGEAVKFNLSKDNSHAPKVSVEQNEKGEAALRDFGETSDIKGTLRDSSNWGNRNVVCIYLDYAGIPLASAAVISSDGNSLAWSMTVPERMKDYLPNGLHSAEIAAVDIDGNETKIPLMLNIDVVPFDLKIKNPLYTRSFAVDMNGKQKWFIDFSAEAKENSFLSLKIDGQTWANNLFLGDERSISTRLFLDVPLAEGRHKAFATLARGNEKKEFSFDIIVDNSPPKLKLLNYSESGANETGKNPKTLLPYQDASLNIISNEEIFVKPFLSSLDSGEPEYSPIKIKYALAESIDEISRIFEENKGDIIPEEGKNISLPQNKNVFLGIAASDEAKNQSPLIFYLLHYDSRAPMVQIGSVEQKSFDLKKFDRNSLWITLDQGETEPMAARYDIAASLSENGPWNLLSRSIIENAPAQLPWTWNELLNENEWLTLRKVGEKFVPFNTGMKELKSLLGVEQFPSSADENKGALYLRVRSKDFAGNEFVSAAQSFILSVDRQAPKIFMGQSEFHIIDFTPQCGTISGHVTDKPEEENDPILIRLFKDDTLIAETTTYNRIGGVFELPIKEEHSSILPNGMHSIKIVATDYDGNRLEQFLNVRMDVKPLQVEIPDKVYIRSLPANESGVMAIELDVGVVPNSQISLRVAGRQAFTKVSVGPVQKVKQMFDIPFKITGDNPALFQVYKNGRSASKIFRLIVDDEPPSSSKLFLKGTSQELHTTQETEMNILPQSLLSGSETLLNIQAGATDDSSLFYQLGTGRSMDSARREMMASEKGSGERDLKIAADVPCYIALGVTDMAGNISEFYYPVLIESTPAGLSIDKVAQLDAEEKMFDRNYLWIYTKQNEEWTKLRYDIAVSIDGQFWKNLSRDIIDNPPPLEPWFWRQGSGERWENLSGRKDEPVPFVTTLEKVRELLGVESLPVENGKRTLYVRVRGIDAAGNKTVPQIEKAYLETDSIPPDVNIDIGANEALDILDFGPRAGAVISGWIKDSTPGENFADIFIMKGANILNKSRVFIESGQARSWQIYIPESSAEMLPNGMHQLTVKALDGDGNSSSAQFLARINVISDDIQIENPIYLCPVYKEGKSAVRFSGIFKENSSLAVFIDGKKWLENYAVGTNRNVTLYLESDEKLQTGEHEIVVRLTREGVTTEKRGKAIFKNNASKIHISRIEQKSYDEKTFDRHSLWLYLKSGGEEFAAPRFDIAVSRQTQGPWILLTRNVIEKPPMQEPWIWRTGTGERWQNFTCQEAGCEIPLFFNLPEIRELAGGKPALSGAKSGVFYFRLRSIDQAGNSVESEPYRAEIESDSEAPEIEVNGQSESIRISDFGPYAVISGMVRDKPCEPSNYTQIFLRKNGISVATTAVKTESDIFSRWEMSIPKSAKQLLDNGFQELEIAARDADGNETKIPIKLIVEMREPFIEVEEPLFMRTDVVSDRTKKSSFHLRARLKENSEISLNVDGQIWASGINVGAKSEIDERIESSFFLAEGAHKAEIILKHEGQSISKEFEVLVDNSPPKIVSVTELNSNQLLKPESENSFSNSDITLSVNMNEPNFKAGHYAISSDPDEISKLLSQGEDFKDTISSTLLSGSSSYLEIEIEDKSGLIARQFYMLSCNTNSPSSSFDPKYFILIPEGEASSGRIVALNDGQNPLLMAGKLSARDAPGFVEVIGFKKHIGALSDSEGHWQMMVPAEIIPKSEEVNAHIQVTGRNRKKSLFPLKIMNASEVAKILLENPVPEYLKSRMLTIKGSIKTLVPVESFYALLRPGKEKVFIVSNGISATDKLNRTEYDKETGRFSITFSDIEEKVYSVEIAARTVRGQETIYTQEKDGQKSIPSIVVDATPPHPPTLKIVSRAEGGVTVEGKADADPYSRVVIVDGKGNVLARALVYFQSEDENAAGNSARNIQGTWNRKIENLPSGDYEIYAYAEDIAGNRSLQAGPEKFTIYKGFGSKPKMNDFSKGRGTYSESPRPLISGNAGIPKAQVQIFETGNYIGYAMADGEGNFSFIPQEELKNGWKNFIAVVSDLNGQRMESDILRIYFSVNGMPVEERLSVKTEPKTIMERETISFLVSSKEGVPMAGAKVIFAEQEADTNSKGRVDMVSPSLRGASSLAAPVRAELILPNGMKLAGSSLVNVIAGDAWDIRFSPNGDGINDYVVFNAEDIPVRITQWKRDEMVKVVTEADGCRWDGKKGNQRDCEQSIYLAETRTGRKLVISLYK